MLDRAPRYDSEASCAPCVTAVTASKGPVLADRSYLWHIFGSSNRRPQSCYDSWNRTIGKWYKHRDTLYECIGHYPGGRGEFLSRDGRTHGALVGDYEEVDYEPYFDHEDIVRIKAEYLPECHRRYGVEEGWMYRPNSRVELRGQVEVERSPYPRKGRRKYTFPFMALELVRG